MSISPQTAWITIALRIVRGSTDSAGAAIRMARTAKTAAERPPTCDLPPARSTAAVFDRLPATPRPPKRPSPTLAAPRGDELLISVQPIAVPGGEQPSRAQPLGKTDQSDRSTSKQHVNKPIHRHEWHRRDGQSTGYLANYSDAVTGEMQPAGRDEPADQHHHRPGKRGASRGPVKRIARAQTPTAAVRKSI